MFLCGKLLILTVHFAVISAHFNNADYCSVPTCKPRTHVMCEYTEGGGAATCGIGHKPYPLTKEQELDLLDWHNKIRVEVATGGFFDGVSEPVSNMHELSWSMELQKYAQRWADQCNLVLELGYDTCRNTIDTKTAVGQNVFSHVFATESDTIDSFLNKLKWQWSRTPLEDSDPQTMSALSRSTQQVIWPATNTLGCAQTHFTNGTHRIALIVCNYGGRVDSSAGGPRFGASCSECSRSSMCSEVNPGLCSTASRTKAGLIAVMCIAGIRRGTRGSW